MSNYKIRVNSKAESKEAQGLLEKLGFKKFVWGTYSDYFIFANSNYYSRDNISNFSECDYKEITLPELRDLVVLKRNNVGDATHVDQYGDKWIFVSGIWYFYSGKNKWDQTLANLMSRYELKPIEKKEMKEYLAPEHNYELIVAQSHHAESNWVEIPAGAEKLTACGLELIFWTACGDYSWHTENSVEWDNNKELGLTSFDQYFDNETVVLWSRHTHPEELPFIDDEPSLNDQYAEIEKVRQSAWQKQEGGSHYKNLKIQPMQYALENKLDYAQANVVKYVTRHADKNGKEDLLKAIHNLELMIEFYYGDEK